ncbi:MAG: hypothetical protein ACTH4F_11585, partial [Psychrobacter sp.]
MPKMSVAFAMTLLVLGNIIAVFSDTLIKALPSETAVYQFILFRQCTAVLMLLPFCLILRLTHEVQYQMRGEKKT